MSDGVLRSLWRAVALFRVAALVAGLSLIGWWWADYAHAWVAASVGAGMVVVTIVIGFLAVSGRAQRPAVVIGDLAVTVALTAATIWAQTPAQLHGAMPTLTTIWAAGPVLEAGFLFGWLGGLVGGCIQLATAVWVRHGADSRTLSSGIILLVAGAVVGYVATLAVNAEAALAEVVRARAALAERERLASGIHDGALQVLALVHRTGRDGDGVWPRLAAAAAEQEAALRHLLSTTAPASNLSAPSARDVAAALRALGREQITVSTPAGAVLLDAATADDVEAAVGAALHNVGAHAGPHAQAWVLLEELDREVRVTIRDDGLGFAPGRLVAAAAAGRLGVTTSIRSRIERHHGRVQIESAPGAGTVVELVVPIGERSR
jgi:signal transduction histidine kinase